MSYDPNEHNSDHCFQTGMAWKEISKDIEKQIGRTLEDWTGPKITAEHGTYKLDWYAPDDLEDTGLASEYVTLYDDGVWQFYGKDGELEGKILPLHDRRWADRMVKANVLGGGQVAWFSVQFFKQLKEK